jgi:flagellar biosynthesis protein FliQ
MGDGKLGAERALFLLNEMVWTALMIAGPLLGVTLVVGLAVSVLQTATQIQEITLSYVPKLLAAAFVLIVLGGWMMGALNRFAEGLYALIPYLGE